MISGYTSLMKTKLFEEKNIAPMLIKEQQAAFNDPDFIFELKFDGLRCIAYLDPERGTDLRNKRDVPLLKLYPELKELHRYVDKCCILDGELVFFENGIPNFYFLQKHVKDCGRLYINRYIEEMGIPFYEAVEERNLEGIVAKRKDSIYLPGKRSRDWIKIKNINEDDFIVCGYFYQQSVDRLTLILGQYLGDKLMHRGNVSLGVNNLRFLKEYEAVRSSKALFNLKINNVVWLEPQIVCIINYMYKTNKGVLRQPVRKGFRDDKHPLECRIVEP